MIEIACRRCERRGRLSAAQLIEQHGADIGLPSLCDVLAGDCPKRESVGGRRAVLGVLPAVAAPMGSHREVAGGVVKSLARHRAKLLGVSTT